MVITKDRADEPQKEGKHGAVSTFPVKIQPEITWNVEQKSKTCKYEIWT